MGTSYLKALHLQKKLEEQAKQEAENRTKAESLLEEIDKAISEYKKAGIDVSDIEDEKKKANEYVSAKEFGKAVTILEGAKGSVEEAKDSQVENMFSSSEDMILLSKTLGGNVSKAEELLDKAKKARDDEESLEKVVKLARSVWGEAEKILQERISGTFSAAQSLLRKAKEIGEDIEAGESLFKEAREAVDNGEYRDALGKLSECVVIVGSKVASTLRSSSEDIKKTLDMAENMGIDVAKYREQREGIETLLDDAEYEEALKTTNLLKEGVGKALSDGLGEQVKRAEQDLKVAKNVDADTKNAEELLSEGKKALYSGDYLLASEKLSACNEEVGVACFQNVLKVISSSRGNFLTAKKIGMDLSSSIDLLNKARSSLKEGRYEEAISFAQKSDAEIESKIIDFKKAEESLHKIEENISTAEELGIDTAFSQQIVSEARNALEANDFSKALDLINKGKDKIENAEYSKIEEAVEQAQIGISLAEKVGVDVSEATELLDSSIFHLKNKEFKDSLGLAKKVNEDMTKSAKNRILEITEAGRIFLNENAFTDATDAMDLLNNAEEALSEGLLEEAYKLTEKSNEAVARLQSDRVRKMLSEVEAGMAFMKKYDADVSKLVPSFNRASSLLKDEDYRNAIEAARDCMEKLLELEKEAFENVFSSTKLVVVDAKRKGIDIEGFRKALEEAKGLYAHGRYADAISVAVDAKKSAEELKDKYAAAYSSITEVAGLITEAKKDGVEIKNVAKALMQAKKFMETQDFDKAITISTTCKSTLEKIKAQYKAAKSMVNYQALVSSASNIDIDVSEETKKLEKAKSLMREKNFVEALELAEERVSAVEREIETHLLDIVSKTETAVETARGIGISVSDIKKMVEGAKTKLKEGNFENAYSEAKKAHDTIEHLRELSQKAVLSLQEAKASISNASNVGADVTAAKILMDQAVQDIKDNKYEEAISKSEKVKASVEAAQAKRVGGMLDSVEKVIKDAASKVDTSSSLKFLKEGRALLENKQYKEALNAAMKSEGEMKNVRLQHKMAEESISSTKTRLEEMAKEGIPGGDAKALMDEAKKAFAEKDYVKVLSLSVEAGEKAHTIKEAHLATKEVVMQAVNRIKSLKEQGADVKSSEAILAGATSEFKSQNYSNAKDYAAHAIEEAEKKYDEFVSKKIDEIEREYVDARQSGGTVERARTILADARIAHQNKEYSKVFALIDKTRIVLNYEKKGAVRKKISMAEVALEEAKSKGADIGDATEILHDAIENLENNDYKTALELSEKTLAMVSDVEGERKELEDILLATESLMAKAKKFGLDMKNVRKMYDDARAMRENDISQALSLAETSRDESVRIMDELAPRISVRARVGTVYRDEWTTVELVFLNTGRSVAKDVRTTILGAEVRGLKEISSIIGGKSETQTVQILLKDAGEKKLTINGYVLSMVDKKDLSFSQELIIDVAEKPSFKKVQASEAGKCSLCNGTIKKDMEIVVCECGKTYHVPCSERKGKCSCGKPLTEETKPKEESKDQQPVKKKMVLKM